MDDRQNHFRTVAGKLVSLCRTVGSTLFDMWRRSSYTHPGGCGGSCRFSPIGLRPTFQRSGEFCHKVVHLLCAMEQAPQPLGRFPLLRRAAAPSPDVAVLCVVRQAGPEVVHWNVHVPFKPGGVSDELDTAGTLGRVAIHASSKAPGRGATHQQ